MAVLLTFFIALLFCFFAIAADEAGLKLAAKFAELIFFCLLLGLGLSFIIKFLVG